MPRRGMSAAWMAKIRGMRKCHKGGGCKKRISKNKRSNYLKHKY